MRKIKLLVIAVLCLILTLSSVGCKPKETSQEKSNHYVDIEKTDSFISKNGVTSYRFVVPDNMSKDLLSSIVDFNDLMQEATGVHFEQVSENAVSYTDDSEFISIGDNKYLQSAGIPVEKDVLGEEGVRILTKGKSVFIFGADEKGTINGLYKFLNLTFDFEQYSRDNYSIDKVYNFELMDYDVVEVPDIVKRFPGAKYIMESRRLASRMGFSIGQAQGKISVENRETGVLLSSQNHTAFTFAPPSLYNDNVNHPDTFHPDWYSSSGDQLCYTCHGNQEEYNALVDQIVKIAKYSLQQDLVSKIMLFASEDSWTICSCPHCVEAAKKYGASSGAIIKMCNDVNRQIREWFKTEEGKPYAREFYFTFLAYNHYTEAPVDIKCDDGVAVMYAPIAMQFTKPFSAPENSSFNNSLKKWGECTDTLMYWLYSTNYTYGMMPYNIFDSMQEIYKEIVAVSDYYLMFQCQSYQPGIPTGWSVYKNYLFSKLSWNVNSDLSYYESKFFDNYFGDAGDTMYEIFSQYRKRAILNAENGYEGGVYFNEVFSKSSTGYVFWKKNQLLDWIDKCNYALEQIEPMKIYSYSKYLAQYNAIICERLSYYYILIYTYAQGSSEEQLLSWKKQFKHDAGYIGLKMNGESVDLDAIYAGWGV